MSRFRWYGPTLVLLVTALAVLLLTPALIRTLTWSTTNATIQTVRNDLATNPSLIDLSEAFKQVAQAVEPSVVHIEIESKNRPRRQSQQRVTPDNLPRGFGDMFEEFFRNDPRFQEPAEPQNTPDPSDDYSRYNDFRPVANGSGWVYRHQASDAQNAHTGNYVITNAHVVDNVGQNERIKVTFIDNHVAYATIVGADADTDVAVLKLDDNDDFLHPAAVTPTTVEQGEIVFAFGSPFGAAYSFSMSQGIVSAVGRSVGIIGNGRGYENFIQTDAAINPGNSGGPLVNTRGEVVGMNTAIASRTGTFNGIGFAIPVDLATNIADRLILDGTVQRGFLGVSIENLTANLADTFGYDSTDGVLINDFIPGFPAETSGLQPGDIVTAVNGQTVRDSDDLRFAIADLPPGAAVTLRVFRDGEQQDFQLTLGNRADLRSASGARPNRQSPDRGANDPTTQSEKLRKLGITSLETLTPNAARRLQVDAVQGVLVTGVRNGSIAAARTAGPLPQLFAPRNGTLCVITQVGATDVATVDQLHQAVNALPDDAPLRFTVKTWLPDERRYTQRFVVLALD